MKGETKATRAAAGRYEAELPSSGPVPDLLGYHDCCERLEAGDLPSRIRAARELPEWGEAAVASLVAVLASPEPGLRLAAIEALRTVDSSSAVSPLQAMLRDPVLPVRSAAAVALGEIGDLRSLPALIETLQGCFLARSARKQLWLGIAVVPITVLLQLWWTIFGGSAAQRGLYLVTLLATFLWSAYASQRRPHGPVCQSCVTAISQVVERNPGTDLQPLVPELRAVAGDLFLQARETRKLANRAVAHLEARRLAMSNLPVPSSNPETVLTSLPRPAEPPVIAYRSES